MRLIDFFDRGVAIDRDRICLDDADIQRSYAEVQRRSYRIAHALAAAGLGVGARAAVYSPNCVTGMEAMLGIFRAGAAWVPINTKNAIDENVRSLDLVEAEILFYHSSLATEVAHYRATCPSIRFWICLDRPDGGDVSLDAWIAAHPDTDPDVPAAPRDPIAILLSGGTTGRSKAVVLSHLNWETMIANFYLGIEVGPRPVHLVVTPMTHASGVVAIILFAAGAHTIFLPGFDGATVLETIERRRVSHLFLPPTAIYMLLATPGIEQRDVTSLRGFLYAAAPMSVDKLRRCLDLFGPVMIQTFGQAEAPLVCTILTADDHRVVDDPALVHRLASCGRATLLADVAIMDDEGRLQPAGTRGEIVVRGNLVMSGYYNNPEETAAVSQFGWHHTGDVGFLDTDDYLFIVDRKKDMIISGGFNVYPNEVEQVISAQPGVQDCAVIGVPDEKWGEAITAVIELASGGSVTAEQVIALCKARLGSVKTPKAIEFWAELPRTTVGKIDKKKIREAFWQGRDRLV